MQKSQVVIQTAFLGDLILSIPFLKRVKKNAPEQKLILVCKKGLGSFLKNQNIIDDFVEIAKGQRDSYQQAERFLSQFEITRLFCVHRSIRSLLFSFKLRAQRKIGFRSFLGFFVFHESYHYEKTWPDAIRKFKLLSAIDSEVREALQQQDFSSLNMASTTGEMPHPPQMFAFESQSECESTSESRSRNVSENTDTSTKQSEHKQMQFMENPSEQKHRQIRSTQEQLVQNKRQVCVFPGSVWATKRWTEEGFTQVVRDLLEKKYQVLLLGGPDEKKLCDAIATKAPGVQVLAGKLSIQESLQQVAESSLVIANDSAATHMAAFKDVPCITLFGPTTLSLGFRPWSNKAHVIQVDLNCRPCGAHGSTKCPLGHHNCMKMIKSETVTDKALKFLKQAIP